MRTDSIGLYMFIYSCIAVAIWPAVFVWMARTGAIEGGGITGRDFANLKMRQDYVGMLELIEIGKQIGEHELRQMCKALKQMKDEDPLKERIKRYVPEAMQQEDTNEKNHETERRYESDQESVDDIFGGSLRHQTETDVGRSRDASVTVAFRSPFRHRTEADERDNKTETYVPSLPLAASVRAIF
eukprot:CAMPEP_0197079684 /NCGR_PEP_ID=MMETSP1384-20130603/213750_1 /TAXON_ID=29189 /ORGANISM="Ammonia sp." /LENGTH=184 /DNA_ID=CAMNT_0042518563 /DNA_START=596 /DNA_END=1150 /DNA_ORIENTATION=-